MVDVVIVAWHILSLLEDAFYSLSFKALDMLMLKLQDGVSSHNLCADVMLFLVHHQRVVLCLCLQIGMAHYFACLGSLHRVIIVCVGYFLKDHVWQSELAHPE